ncbi:hypothetical protein Glove_410g89 [Diversispora epigaea]|uniref:Uncharacterized protein n=1 Tax=Diversispora epigaea TaxID=1348612 RepID=A0A397GXX4_9GLOM|nr:hypothetical protein Glove_410g89 [Diversispora epigaea]
MSSEQLKQKFKQLPKFVQKKLHHIGVDGTKLVGECDKNQEAKKKLRLILKEIDFIHLHFNESEGELLKIARELLRPFRNKFINALEIFVPKQAVRPEASSSNNSKRKRNSGDVDGGNKRTKRQ